MYAIDRQTDVKRASSFNAPTIGGHNKYVAMRIDPRYDALSASRLSWLVIMTYTWALYMMQVFLDV